MLIMQTDEWESEHVKEKAFQEYVCLQSITSPVSQENQAVSVAIDVQADPDSSQRDKRTALDITLKHTTTGDWEPMEPLYVTPDGKTCEGWVFEKLLEQQAEKEYANFTPNMAREVGIYID